MNGDQTLDLKVALGILQFARDSARAPTALERLQYVPAKDEVRLVSDKREGPTTGTHSFPALEFLAMLLAHVPDPHEVTIRNCGAYSSRRARWRRDGILTGTRPLVEISPAAGDRTPDWPALPAIAFILDPDVTTAIPRHLRRAGRDPRALPEHAAARAGRDPP